MQVVRYLNRLRLSKLESNNSEGVTTPRRPFNNDGGMPVHSLRMNHLAAIRCGSRLVPPPRYGNVQPRIPHDDVPNAEA